MTHHTRRLPRAFGQPSKWLRMATVVLAASSVLFVTIGTGTLAQAAAGAPIPPTNLRQPPVSPDLTKSNPGTPGRISPPTGYVPDIPGSSYGRLRVKVIDGRTRKPLEGAEVVVIETEKRFKTDKDGLTPWIQAPVLRSARYRFLVNELHGQLNLISYKDGYRDSVHMGVRVNEGSVTKTTIWQYKIIPGSDVRVEPVLYQEPYHRLWIIQLADRFRRPSQLGEGYERP